MEFIRKDELKEMLHKSIEYWGTKDDCTVITLLGVVDDVNKLPTIDSETVVYPSRPKGKWIRHQAGLFDYHYCSICEKQAEVLQDGGGCELLSNYCPNCGADMRGEE